MPILVGSYDAIKAVFGQADPSVQAAFDQSVSDRTLGTLDAAVAFGTGGLITSVGGPTFDPANRASAETFASGVFIAESILLPGAGLLDGLAEEGTFQALACLRQCFSPNRPWRGREGGFFHSFALV